jgi:hypothetical protein
MDQSATTVTTESISPSKSITRDMRVMLPAGMIVIAISFLFAVAGVPIRELDNWMFALSVPWFALLYLVSRKPSLLKARLIKPIRAIGGIAAASAAIGAAASAAIANWTHELLRTLSSLLH